MALSGPHPFTLCRVLAFLGGGCLQLSEARLALSLDGTWQFSLDPANPATQRLTSAGHAVSGEIRVPGAWQGQGYGEETATMKHQYEGVATYTQKVALPASFTDSTKYRLYVVAERIQRSAKLFVGDTLVCEHMGYLSNLDCEVEASSIPSSDTGGMLSIRLMVNSTRALGTDGLVGEEDLITDGTNFGGWGGLGGHVRLEARSNDGWMIDPWIRHAVADSFKTATLNATITVSSVTKQPLVLRASFLDGKNKTVGNASSSCEFGAAGQAVTSCSIPDIQVDSPALWSPRSPVQYTALLELVTASGVVVDHQSVKFGIRRLDTIGYHWKLNGLSLYLHGYGDDSIYPETVSPPLNRSLYASRLSFAKSLGMNFVRHHSHILPDEYFEAACEAGMLISAEFPIAYGGILAECPGTGCDSFYESQWASAIRRLRNYPCVFDYTMNNEKIAMHDAQKLYAIAKGLDPTRPVNTADGVFSKGKGNPAGFEKLMNPEDFRPVQFNLGQIPMGDPHQFQIIGTPPVPIINHEMGNFVTWPRLDDQISRFQHNIKPYWLTPARDEIQKNGLLSENDLWSRCSRELYLFCWKDAMEAVRKTEKISGYEWWLLQDFWKGSNGIVDTYFVSKHPPQELDQIRRMNGAVLLLVAEPADNLPLPDTEPRLLRAYTSKDTLQTSLHVSNQGVADIFGARLTWTVTGTSASGHRTSLCNGTSSIHSIPQGPGTTKLVPVECQLPDLGSFHSAPQPPMALVLETVLEDAHGQTLAENQWRSRLYAAPSDGVSAKGRQVYTTPTYCTMIPIMNMICHIPAVGTKLPPGSVLVVDYFDEAIVGFAAEGATVLMLRGSKPARFGGLPTDLAAFKTAWWLGGPIDNNMGTVVYNNSAPFTQGMAPDGWADETWFNLVQGGQNFLLEGILQGSVETLIRSVDLMGSNVPTKTLQDSPFAVMARGKALAWQARVVPTGAVAGVEGGAIIAAGLNLLVNTFTKQKSVIKVPEAAWILHKLLDYAFTSPKPSKTLEAKITKCPGCLPPVPSITLCPATGYTETFV